VIGTREGGAVEEREHRRAKLTPEQKWQVFLEASRKHTTDAEVCRRWGITIWQLKAIRERVKEGSITALKKKPGRAPADPEAVRLRAELDRSNDALCELAIENTLLRGKVNGV
jgi:transposase-like protein